MISLNVCNAGAVSKILISLNKTSFSGPLGVQTYYVVMFNHYSDKNYVASTTSLGANPAIPAALIDPALMPVTTSQWKSSGFP